MSSSLIRHIAVPINAKTGKSVSKGEWLAQALEVLSAEAVQGIRIERLARDPLSLARFSLFEQLQNIRQIFLAGADLVHA